MKTLYFDFAASSPVDKRVFRVMQPYFENVFASPGAVHSCGQKAIAAVDKSRQTIAQILKFDSVVGRRQIIFTGSATEANNLALVGSVSAWVALRAKPSFIPRMIISSVEHDSILETARNLAQENKIELVIIPVNQQGFINLSRLKSALNDRTILVSVMFAQNEIGSIQPIEKIARIIQEFKKSKKSIDSPGSSAKLDNFYPLFHTDAAQAFQYLECAPILPAVNLMTLSGHKIYGPKGVGLLYIKESPVKEGALIKPIIAGGGQEFGLRSGTENTPAIVGLAKAMELADANRSKESARIYGLRYFFWQELKKIFPKLRLNGPLKIEKNASSDSGFLPSILNISFQGYLNEELILKFDLVGISVSAGSACASRSTKPSHVLKAIGLSEKNIQSSLRFSFGRTLTKADIKEAVRRLTKLFVV